MNSLLNSCCCCIKKQIKILLKSTRKVYKESLGNNVPGMKTFKENKGAKTWQARHKVKQVSKLVQVFKPWQRVIFMFAALNIENNKFSALYLLIIKQRFQITSIKC